MSRRRGSSKPTPTPLNGRGLQSRLTDEQDDAVAGGVQPVFSSKLLNLREGGALVRRKTRLKVGW